MSMLIREVTTADDKLRLLKTIFDNTWSAMSAEVAADKAAQQQRAAAAARKPRARRAPTPAPKRGADANTASTAQKTAPPQTQATTADKTAAQLVLKGQTAAQAQQQQQPQQRRSYPTTTQAKPQAFAPPKPVARLGKVVAQPIK